MRFQVPQFIETEEKIFGPFTLKQFFWVLGAVVILFISFIGFGILGLFLVGMPIAVILMALGFLPVQGVLLSTYLFHAVQYLLKPKKYFYKNPNNNQNKYHG